MNYKVAKINNFKCYIEDVYADKIEKTVNGIEIAAKLLGYTIDYSQKKKQESANTIISIIIREKGLSKFRLLLSFNSSKILKRVLLKYSHNGYLNQTIDSFTPNGIDLFKPIEVLNELL